MSGTGLQAPCPLAKEAEPDSIRPRLSTPGGGSRALRKAAPAGASTPRLREIAGQARLDFSSSARGGRRRSKSSSPACGGGRVGASGRATRQRPVTPQDPPPTPPASGRGDGWAGGTPRLLLLRSRRQAAHSFSSPACGGGRAGASGRATRQGPSRRRTLPQPLPQAGGGMVGRAGAPRLLLLRSRRQAALQILLPRLRGRPGGGQRPCNPARPVTPRDPPPAPPASGRGDDGAGSASQASSPACRGGRLAGRVCRGAIVRRCGGGPAPRRRGSGR